MKRKKHLLKYIIFVVVLPMLAYTTDKMMLWVTWDFDWNFQQANSCLNNGGVWEQEIARCWYAGQCEDEGGQWYGVEHRCIFDRP